MRIRSGAALCAGILVLAACSSDAKSSDAKAGSSTTTKSSDSKAGSSTTAAKAKPLTVLVSNDDGYAAPGISTMVEALRAEPGVTVVVSAPATDQSGQGTKTSPGPLTATEQKTAGGFPATAVNGTPADSVVYALDNQFKTTKPDLVVTGINKGQNLGPVVTVSGTVGAAATGANAGIPALAVSAGLGDPSDYASAATFAMQWVRANHDALAAGKGIPAQIVLLNVPTCSAGTVRGLKQVPPAGAEAAGRSIVANVDCNQTTTDFTDDVGAFNAGFATVSNLSATEEPVTSTTSFPGG